MRVVKVVKVSIYTVLYWPGMKGIRCDDPFKRDNLKDDMVDMDELYASSDVSIGLCKPFNLTLLKKTLKWFFFTYV